MTTIVRDQLLDAACEATGLDEFGDVPFLEALDVLLDSFNHDVDLAEPVGNAFVAMVTGLLAKRLRLVDDRPRHPEIAQEAVAAPIFIVGQPRSGFDAPARVARVRRRFPRARATGR